MTGYIRKDTTNNIADGNVINATDLDNEFDGVQAAFVVATGHTHDGTASEGAAITKIGPVQDVVVSIASMSPKTTNTIDLGTSSLKYKDAYFAGNETVGGTLAVTGVATLTAQPVLSSLTASQAVFTDASKGLVSNAITGTGNVVMSTSPTLVTPVLGTPASGTVTNLTGTASININGTVGATTASTVAATTLTTSSTVTLNGGTANGVTYLNGSKVLTSGTALTYNGTGLGVGVASAGFALDVGGSNGTNIALRSTGTTSAVFRAYVNSAEAGTIGFLNGGGTYFEVAGSEGMRLTSTGLGIGTSSPNGTLTINKPNTTNGTVFLNGATSTPDFMRIKNTGGDVVWGVESSTGGSIATGSSAYAGVLYTVGSTSLQFGTNGAVKATIDSSGNLGLGVTPSAWGSVFKAFDIGANGNISSDGGGLFLPNNAYDSTGSGGWKYKLAASQPATLYLQTSSGEQRWYTAPSGTAGDPITFTQAMTLDASGRLLVGKTAQAVDQVGAEITTTGIRSTIADSTNASLTYIVYSATAAAYRFYVGFGGTVYATNTTITSISDQRLKENIRDLDDGLDVVMALKPRKFDWKEGTGKNIKDDRGFIAQEFEQVLPDMIEEWKDPAPEGEEPYKAVNANLIPTLVKAIQEQQALIESLTQRLAAAGI